MSHFLQIADRIKRLSAENYNIVEGIVSHISLPRKKRILTNIGLTDCKLLKQKLNNRYKEEVNTAIEMNMKSLQADFKRMKQAFYLYGKSEKYKLAEMFQLGDFEKKIDESLERKNMTRRNREIILERKYNMELALKFACIAETQDRTESQLQIRSKLNSLQHSPLVRSLTKSLSTHKHKILQHKQHNQSQQFKTITTSQRKEKFNPMLTLQKSALCRRRKHIIWQ